MREWEQLGVLVQPSLHVVFVGAVVVRVRGFDVRPLGTSRSIVRRNSRNSRWQCR